jgi:putative ABC transport system substrate-binding protein
VTFDVGAGTRALGALVVLLLASLTAGAQPTGKIYRIGVIQTTSPREVEHVNKALDDALRQLGYVQGQHYVMERRFADGRQERLPALAAELVRLKVDVIVTGSNPVIAAVKQATSTIPVVMAVSRDPVGAGFITSLARPGGNITGLANDPTPEIQGKNLEFLTEAVPRLSRVALLWNPVDPGAEKYRNAVEHGARRLGVAFRAVEVRARPELDGAFATMLRDRTEAVVVLQDPVLFSARRDVVRLAAQHRLPAVYAQSEFVDAGGLMSYGVNIAQQFRRAAVYVDRILKGARPGELAVEQAAEFELTINVGTAKALGLTIPPSLRLRADRIVE